MSTPNSPVRSAPASRKPRRPLVVLGAAMLVATLPSAVFAAHAAFVDGPFGVHDPGVHYVSEAGITAGCGDGTRYCANDPVTRGQMATFLHRMSGNGSVPPNVNAATLAGLSATDFLQTGDPVDADTLAGLSATDFLQTGDSVDAATLGGQPPSAFAPAFVSAFEQEPNSAPESANEHPLVGPAHGAVVEANHDYWRVEHTGGELVGGTFTVNCADSTFGDTVLALFDSAGTQLTEVDDTNGFCSRITTTQPAGTYFFRVRGFAEVTVPYYGLIAQTPGVASSGPTSTDDAAAAEQKP